MSTFTRVGLSLITLIVALFVFFGPSHPKGTTTSSPQSSSIEHADSGSTAPNPVRILSVQAGSRFIEVYGDAEKGLFTFHPRIERDDAALLIVLRTVIEQQFGQRLAPQEYINDEQPRRLVMGSPGNQYRVLTFKDTSSGEVFMAHIERR